MAIPLANIIDYGKRKLVFVVVFLIALLFLKINASDSNGITGTVIRHAHFTSQYVDARNIDVWLPPDYDKQSDVHYPVLYLHDGQNLFDPTTSFIGVDWGIDETMTQLIEDNFIKPAIVVGIWNTPLRFQEYMPQRPIEEILPVEIQEMLYEETGGFLSDSYLKFIVEELKPFIDSTYRTLPNRDHTFIMGSSMGALISIYAVCEYPDVFKGAGAVSTHWPVLNGIVIAYLQTNLPPPGSNKFYYDYGTETLDAEYEPLQKLVDEIMRSAGYTEGENWVTHKFEGAEHSERAWRERAHIPIEFFLGRE